MAAEDSTCVGLMLPVDVWKRIVEDLREAGHVDTAAMVEAELETVLNR